MSKIYEEYVHMIKKKTVNSKKKLAKKSEKAQKRIPKWLKKYENDVNLISN